MTATVAADVLRRTPKLRVTANAAIEDSAKMIYAMTNAAGPSTRIELLLCLKVLVNPPSSRINHPPASHMTDRPTTASRAHGD